ncbi:hypothetical protein FB567DRAFT_495516 [Paraphoma chrysanthemicola]|uniref:Fungal N-terminal domain-containing protein n=1 Tax=Paraphoma chrysanthemicola TaxID=798071 RepID=A0A8K0R5L4_9PLEO|nr:hypothetical protein FB567DRAFT_495516 [Paraphoma chrysanthemicola]
MTVPKTGDVLSLSRIASKIGRAFATGRKDVPNEFQEVATEVSGVTKALTELAEVLQSRPDDCTWQEVGEDIQHGICTIFSSCKRAIDHLDSLVDQYQTIRKHRTIGGFAIERSWSDLVLTQHDTMVWTSEGGDLSSLKSLWRMHSSALSILVQAAHWLTITSPSDSHLESLVGSISCRIDSTRHVDASIDERPEELHEMLQQLTTVPTATKLPVPRENPARSPILYAESAHDLSRRTSPSPNAKSGQNASLLDSGDRAQQSPAVGPRISHDLRTSPRRKSSVTKPSSPGQKRVSELSFGVASLRYSSSSYASSTASSGAWSDHGAARDSIASHDTLTSSKTLSPLSKTLESREVAKGSSEDALSLLPPPALGFSTPSDLDLNRVRSHSNLSPFPASQASVVKLHRSSTTSSQRAAFEKEAFRNSAILCDVRGTSVEYSHQINEDDARDVEMIPVCDDCRIAVVRKRVHDPEAMRVRVITSVWTLSDDNTIRVELRMDDDQMYIPYSSYFSPTKVSVNVPCELKFHDVKHGNRPAKLAKTSWVNYNFETPQSAALFQNELMGRTLLATFRTEKTMRIHSGLGKSFTYAEQMCALENLRIWEDTETGAIIALIHFSADFRAGYLAFYINSATNPITVKDDGNRDVKIKGLRVPIEKGGGEGKGRKDSVVEKGKGKEKDEGRKGDKDKEKVITGARVEFATDMEKREFLEMVKEVQRDLVDLPDLLGVN